MMHKKRGSIASPSILSNLKDWLITRIAHKSAVQVIFGDGLPEIGVLVNIEGEAADSKTKTLLWKNLGSVED